MKLTWDTNIIEHSTECTDNNDIDPSNQQLMIKCVKSLPPQSQPSFPPSSQTYNKASDRGDNDNFIINQCHLSCDL